MAAKQRGPGGPCAYKLLDTLTGYSNPEGRCWTGMDLLAEVTGMSARALRRGLAELRRYQLAWTTFPGSTVCQANPYQLAGGLNGWDCAESGATIVPKVAQPIVPKVAHRTPSSSNPKINQIAPGLVDAKRVDDSEPEPGVTTGVKFSFLEEEGVTGDRVTAGEVQAWVDSHVSETPAETQARRCLDHTWAVWEYPAHPYGWKHGKEAAIKHVMASLANWTKFRKDLNQSQGGMCFCRVLGIGAGVSRECFGP